MSVICISELFAEYCIFDRSRRQDFALVENIAPSRQVPHFPQVKGKRLAEVEFSTYSGNHSIALRFEDKTELRFGIEPGFTMYADYADWTTGNHRAIRKYRAIRSMIFGE